MKVLIVGKTGQLARELLRSVPSGAELEALDRSAFDLSRPDSFAAPFESCQPNVVINAAAYTSVDAAESDAQTVYVINEEAVGAMASICATRGARFVHISTDFVFDGLRSAPYRTDDATNPINVYGASKLAGERRIIGIDNLDWRIVRTAWVYASSGRNFLLTMLRLFRERSEVRVVADQVGTPTSAESLADCVWRAALDSGSPTIMHFTDAGVASWYDFAVAIYEEACEMNLVTRPVKLVPISTADYPTPARRPSYSVLDKTETYRRLGIEPVHWRANLRKVMRGLSA